jgi:hypothetical protein
VYVCHSEGEWARKYLSAFEHGMVADANLGFFSQQFPVCIKNGPPPKGHPSDLTELWEAASLLNAFNIL